MFKWIERRKREKALKSDWLLVKVIEATVNWSDVNQTDEIFYYLYENGLGDRQIEIQEKGYAKSERYGKRHKIYLSEIYPWSKGNDLKGCPSYWDTRKNKEEKYVWELYKQLLGK
jgi:hypothetical protein